MWRSLIPTTLMPSIVICPTELWSGILLTTLKGREKSTRCLCSFLLSDVSHQLFSLACEQSVKTWSQFKNEAFIFSPSHCYSCHNCMLLFAFQLFTPVKHFFKCIQSINQICPTGFLSPRFCVSLFFSR